MTRSKAIQLGIGAALVAGWILLRWLNPAWAAAVFQPWSALNKDHGVWVIAVGGTLLVALMTGFLWVLFGPRKRRHPEDGMALGCLSIAAIALAVVMLVFLLCAIFHVYLITNFISFLMMFLAMLILPQLLWAKLKR